MDGHHSAGVEGQTCGRRGPSPRVWTARTRLDPTERRGNASGPWPAHARTIEGAEHQLAVSLRLPAMGAPVGRAVQLLCPSSVGAAQESDRGSRGRHAVRIRARSPRSEMGCVSTLLIDGAVGLTVELAHRSGRGRCRTNLGRSSNSSGGGSERYGGSPARAGRARSASGRGAEHPEDPGRAARRQRSQQLPARHAPSHGPGQGQQTVEFIARRNGREIAPRFGCAEFFHGSLR